MKSIALLMALLVAIPGTAGAAAKTVQVEKDADIQDSQPGWGDKSDRQSEDDMKHWPKPSPDPWTLTFSDEFNGNAIDRNKWTFDIGTGSGGWGNNEQEYYTDRTDNAKVENGNLVITAKKEEFGGSHYTSARLKTSGKFAQKYGKIEVRVKLPVGTGFWPAIWMMPQDSVYGGWAASGEIDIMENKGRTPNTVSGTLHYGEAYPGNTYTGAQYNFPAGGTVADYHTYTIEWEPGEIRFYVDGNLYQTQNDWYSKSANQAANNAYPAPFDQPFYVILNLALGGNFDGGKPIDDTNLPGAMLVDYVRVYQLTGRPFRKPIPVEMPKENLPDNALKPLPDGNLVYNPNFDQDSASVPNLSYLNGGSTPTTVPNTDYWSLFEGAGGAGSVAIEPIGGKNYARIDISKAGSQNYSVQLLHPVSIAKGRYYKLSYDAKAAKPRNMTVKVTGGADRGYSAYSQADTVKLTNQLKHYEMSFQMKQATDIAARTEFNAGLNAQSVWIGNVRMEEIPNIQIDDDVQKTPLGDGNRVYNGTFDQGRQDRMTFWHFVTCCEVEATGGVSEAERAFSMTMREPEDGGLKGANLLQKGISLINAQTYRLTFHANATKARDIQVELTNADGSVIYASQKVHLDSSVLKGDGSLKTVDFTMNGPTDSAAQLVFHIGGVKGIVKIDDVKLIQTSVVYGPDTVFYPLVNGSFDQGLSPWKTATDSGGANSASVTADGKAKITVTSLGANPWSNMFYQGQLNVFDGIVYDLSFDAYASIGRKMEVDVESEDGSYRRYADYTMDLNTQPQHFSYSFTMRQDDSVALKFFNGLIANQSLPLPHDVFLDNVVFQVHNPPVSRPPSLQPPAGRVLAGQQFILSFTDDSVWRSKVKAVKVNGQSTNAYQLSAGNISLDGSNFPAPGTYEIRIEADGYAFTSVNQSILPASKDGNLLLNGSFDTDTNYWSLYMADGSNAAISSVNGQLVVNFPNYDGWEKWSTQLYQTGIPLQSGKTYELSFDVAANPVKDIKVEILRGDGSTHLLNQQTLTPSVTMATYTYSFAVTGTDEPNAKLAFLLGGNHLNGSLFQANSKIYMDNIKVLDKGTTPSGHSLINGTFDTDVHGWQTYTADGSNAVVSSVNGQMQVNFPNYDGWEKWSTQVYQAGLQLDTGKTYELKFDASADPSKDIVVEILRGDGTTHILNQQALTPGSAMNTYTYTFTVSGASESNAKLAFLLGGNHVDGALFQQNSKIYLDNISLAVKSGP